MKKILFPAILSLCASLAVAAPTTSNINLIGGVIAPKQEFSIPLKDLLSYIQYDIHCNINDADNANNQIVIAIYNKLNAELGGIFFNNQYINHTSSQAKLPGVNTQLTITNVIAYGPDAAFAIKNADQTESITLSNCYAVASSVVVKK